MRDIPIQLRAIREQLGLRQSDVARQIDIDQSDISEFETGRKHRLDRVLTAINRIAAVYGYEVVVELREKQL